MDMQKFRAAYAESRNGANKMFRHPLVRNVIYSDGVQACAQSGLYWLLDILATEGVAHMRKHPDDDLLIVNFDVEVDGSARVKGTLREIDPAPWERKVGWTDCEAGVWTFYMTWDGENYTLILPSEW
jgi:hypothetical protein